MEDYDKTKSSLRKIYYHKKLYIIIHKRCFINECVWITNCHDSQTCFKCKYHRLLYKQCVCMDMDAM